jgi:hypothetical protein
VKIRTVPVLVGSPPQGVFEIDAIELDGRLWLVPEWEEVPGQGLMRPVRLVGEQLGRHRRALEFAIPMSVLLGQSPPAPDSGVEVIEHPEVEIPGAIEES